VWKIEEAVSWEWRCIRRDCSPRTAANPSPGEIGTMKMAMQPARDPQRCALRSDPGCLVALADRVRPVCRAHRPPGSQLEGVKISGRMRNVDS